LPDDFAERRLQGTAYARAGGAAHKRICFQSKLIVRKHDCAAPHSLR
jgi:hypothetical protein